MLTWSNLDFHISRLRGRPSIEDIVDLEIKESNGSVAFVACGHPAMVDETRYFCSRNVDNPQKKRVDFMNKFKFGPRMIVLFPNNFNIVLKIYGAWEWLCIFVFS